ncbi:antirestriction protein [Escherichia coli]
MWEIIFSGVDRTPYGLLLNRAEMSPEAAGIAACLMTYSHHACRTENYAMTVHYYRLRDYALQHPECSAIMRIID